MRRCLALVVLLFGAPLLGCSTGVETGNATAVVQVRLTAAPPQQSAGTPLVVVEEDGVPLRVDEAWVGLGWFDFRLPAGTTCADVDPAALAPPSRCEGDRVRVEGPWLVDLLTGAFHPALGALEVPALAYEGVDLHVDALGPPAVDANDPRAGFSLGMQGVYDPDGEAIPFEFRFQYTTDIAVAPPQGLALSAGANEQLTVRLDATQWLAQVPLSACLADGKIEIEHGKLEIEALEVEEEHGETVYEEPCEGVDHAIETGVEDSAEVEVERHDD